MKTSNAFTFKFKNDSYTKRRGTPIMLHISCAQCTNYIMHYQKDGPGPLLRCYLDRIHHPHELEKRQYDTFNKKTVPTLLCNSCNAVIGTPTLYEKENRPAYHMRIGFFKMKKLKK